MNNIVLVLFNDAIDIFRLQFKTFEKFLQPCTINIVLNEDQPKKLKKHIESIVLCSKHTIVFFTKSEILQKQTFEGHGYISQQLCKLLVPIEDDYIVLDDKDLFVKPTTYEQLLNFYPTIFYNIDKDFEKFYLVCCEKFGQCPTVNEPFTPRLIRKQAVNKMAEYFKGKKNLIKWFVSTQMVQNGPFVLSEFILYDFFNDKNDGVKQPLFSGFPSIENIVSGYEIPDYAHIVKIHRNQYNNIHNKIIVDKYFKKFILSPV